MRTIRRQLSRLRWRERGLRLVWGAARFFAVVVAVLASACLADWLIDRRQETPWTLRWTMLLGQSALWLVAAAIFVFRPLFRRMSNSDLALQVEDQVPEFGHRLISAVQLNQPGAATAGMSPALIAAVTRQAEDQAAGVNFAQLANHRRLAWSAYLAAPFAFGIALVFALWSDTVRALLARQFLADWDIPRSVHLESASRQLVWPSGEAVVLRFYAAGHGLSPDMQGEVRIDPEDGQASEHYPLLLESSSRPGYATFVARVPPSVVDFSYRAWLKDGRTRQPARVHFEPPPAVVRQRAWVQLPAYVGLRPDGKRYEQEQPRGDIAGSVNCRARIQAAMQKPVLRATLELLGQSTRRIDLQLLPGGRVAVGEFDLVTLKPDETAYRIVVEDQYGFKNPDPPRRSIRIVPEELPRVALLPERFPPLFAQEGPEEDFEAEGVPVPLGGSIRIAYACTAQYGLGRAQLRYRVNQGKWWRLPLAERPASAQTGPFDPRAGAFARSGWKDQVEFHAVPSADPQKFPGRTEGGGRFDFQTRGIGGLKIGDRIEFCVEVFDRKPDPDRQPGRSETRVKTVVTVPELEMWVRQVLQEESRLRQLESSQHAIFAQTAAREDHDTNLTSSSSAAAGDATAQPQPPAVVQPAAGRPLKGRDSRTATPQPTAKKPKRQQQRFVRDWQLLGPFASRDIHGHDAVFPPEKEKTDLAKAYDGLNGKARWRSYHSHSDYINLSRFYNHRAAAVAYAVCWVHVDRQQQVLFSIGSNDGIKIWINHKLVFAHKIGRAAKPGQDKARADLQSGWNELLLKVDNIANDWGFYLELRDPATGRPLPRVRYQTTPPGLNKNK